MTTIFISYSSKDKSFVEKLVSDLQRHGVNVWWDQLDILPAEAIPQKINEGIQKADYLGIVLSPNSAASPWVEIESNAAVVESVNRNRMDFIIPIMYQDVPLPPILAFRRYADFRSDYSSGLNEVLRALKVQVDSGNKPEQIAKPEIPIWAREEIEKKLWEIPKMRPGFEIGHAKDTLLVVGPTKSGIFGVVQKYEKGMILCHITGQYIRKAFAVYGSIYSRYLSIEEAQRTRLGFPITDELDANPSPYTSVKGKHTTGRYTRFEGGEIIWHEGGEYRGQAFAILDPIRAKYDVTHTTSSLGFPIGETHSIPGGERCDFEGGTIVSVDGGGGVHVVRQLLRIDYSDSPLNHQWKQYKGKEYLESASVRHSVAIRGSKNFIAFHLPSGNTGIQYPDQEFDPRELGAIKYCALTVKSLRPGDSIRFYVVAKTNTPKPLNLEIDTRHQAIGIRTNTWADYLQLKPSVLIDDGDWHTIIIDLEKNVQQGASQTFEALSCFRFRGRIGISDLIVSESCKAIEMIAINPIVV